MSDALYNIEYGLFVITAREGEKDNGCISNSVIQVSSASPQTIAVSMNKKNFTHDMIARTNLLNVSILTKEVPMNVISHFGFQSGRDVNKFEKCDAVQRSENGLYYIPKYTNAFISGAVKTIVDCGTHSIFIAEITEKQVLSDVESVTYSYYQKNIKPKPETSVKVGWRCKVCGYVYEGEELPADFICPWCKHGAADFEKITIE